MLLALLLMLLSFAVRAAGPAGPDAPDAVRRESQAKPPSLAKPPALRPAALVSLPADGVVQRVVLVEKSSQTLCILEAGQSGPRLVERLTCTTGKATGDKRVEGDLKTPEGAYWFTRSIADADLPPLYGAGALVMDYPNALDRLAGKSGSGIWLHGVETNDRVHVARDTRGCVAIRNDDFTRLGPLLRPGETPILIAERIVLEDEEVLARQAQDMNEWLEAWRESWESGDFAMYSSFYSETFVADSRSKNAWLAHKRDLAARRDHIRVVLGSPATLRDGERAWLVFEQRYSSDEHADVGVKRLVLLRPGEQAPWSIVAEEWSPLAGPKLPPRPADRILAQPPRVMDVAAVASPPAPAVEKLEPTVSHALAHGRPTVAAMDPPSRAASLVVDAAMRPTVELTGEAPAAATGKVLVSSPSIAADESMTSEASESTTTEGRVPQSREMTDVPAEPARVTVEAPRFIEESRVGAVEPPPVIAEVPGMLGLPRSVDARLDSPRQARGMFSLLAPLARVGKEVFLDVQLLNSTASMTREGVVLLQPLDAGGAVVTAPTSRRFRIRQGELLSASVPAAVLVGNGSRMRVTIKDVSGRIQLEQDIILEPHS